MKMVKKAVQKDSKRMRIDTYQSKDQQSRLFREQEEECHLWLTQKSLPPENVIHHVNAGTIGGNKILEGSPTTDWKWTVLSIPWTP